MWMGRFLSAREHFTTAGSFWRRSGQLAMADECDEYVCLLDRALEEPVEGVRELIVEQRTQLLIELIGTEQPDVMS